MDIGSGALGAYDLKSGPLKERSFSPSEISALVRILTSTEGVATGTGCAMGASLVGAEADAPARTFYLQTNRHLLGPFSAGQLRCMYCRGFVPHDARVRVRGSSAQVHPRDFARRVALSRQYPDAKAQTWFSRLIAWAGQRLAGAA